MTWLLTGLATAALFLSQVTMSRRTPDKFESPVGSFYWAAVANPSNDSVLVSIIAPRVDSTIRPLGILGPHEFARARLPYADPPLILLYIVLHQPAAGWWRVIPPDSVFQQADST